MPRLDAVEPRGAAAHVVLDGVRAALRSGATEVVDLSDEPVLGYRERFLLMSAALADGVTYVGADIQPRPQVRAGRAHAIARRDRHRQARRQDRGQRRPAAGRRGRRADGVVVVSPWVVAAGGAGGDARRRGRSGGAAGGLAAGRHAATDYFEDAVLAGVTTVGGAAAAAWPAAVR